MNHWNVSRIWHAMHTKTLHGICSGVSEEENEVAGRIRFLARFQKPKAIAAIALVIALLCVGLFCLGGNNPVASAPVPTSTPLATPNSTPSNTGDAALATSTPLTDELTPTDEARATTHEEYTLWTADLTHDGQDEWILWDDIAFAQSPNQPLYIQTADTAALPDEEALWTNDAYAVSMSNAGSMSYSLYQDGENAYLLRYNEAWYSGTLYLYYEVFYLSAQGEEIPVDGAQLEILTDGMPYTEAINDVDAVIDFIETVSAYSAQSTVLVSTVFNAYYLDVATGETSTQQAFIQSTAAQPMQILPSLMMSAQADTAADSTWQETLRAQLEELNAARTENYAEVLAMQE